MSETRVQQLLGKASSLAPSDWARVGFTLCLLGLPLIMGWFAVQQPQLRGLELFGDKPGQALIDRGAAQAELADLLLTSERHALPAPDHARNGALVLLIGALPAALAPRPALGAHKHGRPIDPAAYFHRTFR